MPEQAGFGCVVDYSDMNPFSGNVPLWELHVERINLFRARIAQDEN